jgi:hypothetical protein
MTLDIADETGSIRLLALDDTRLSDSTPNGSAGETGFALDNGPVRKRT